MEKLKICFRVERDGSILAAFPSTMDNRGYVTTYSAIGQHSDASPLYITQCTKPAKPEQYAALYDELKMIYTIRPNERPCIYGESVELDIQHRFS